jgi:hypothetical protein
MLAMALFMERYIKKSLSNADWDKIEAAWLQRFKDKLGNPSRLPRKVMKTYLEYMDMTPKMLDSQMDWDCWPEDNKMEEYEAPPALE